MAEELQAILERIRKEGLEQAQAESERILSAARAQAAEIVARAENEAAERRTKAEQDARAAEERGKKALEQAARDVLLLLEEAIQKTFQTIVRRCAKEAFNEETLRQAVLTAVQAYAKAATPDSPLEVLLSPEDHRRFADILLGLLGQELRRGIEIRSDGSVLSGFKVQMRQDHVEHDFTVEAIADTLCHMVRPHLAEIIKTATGR